MNKHKVQRCAFIVMFLITRGEHLEFQFLDVMTQLRENSKYS